MSRRIINLGTAAHDFGETQQLNDMTAELYASMGGSLNAVQHVREDGSDSQSGRTWAEAKATIAAAVAALPSAGSGGSAHQTGIIKLGAGLWEPSAKILFASEIIFDGSGSGQTDGTRGGTVIKMANGFDDSLFAMDPSYTDWAHFVIFRNLSLEGNKENQSGFGVTRFLDDDNSTTLTFASAGKTITRSAGSWVTDGYTAGQVIRVTGTINNNSLFTIATGGVAASALTVDEAVTDEGPLNGCMVIPSPYNLIEITRPGFQTYFKNVFFRNAPAFGVDFAGAITNMNFLQCGAVKCQEGFAHVFYPDTGNLMNFSLSGTTQLDDCGPAPLFFEDRGDGGVNIAHIENLECEAATTADVHDAIVRYHKIDGNNPMHFNIGTVNAWRAGALGNGTAVVHEMSGGAARWNIYGGVFEDGYTEEFRSDHRNFGTGPNTGQQTGQPILFGLHAGPRVSRWFGKVQQWSGSGSPEGVVTAPVGSTYQRDDGGAGTSFYVKESGTGNTGWAPK